MGFALCLPADQDTPEISYIYVVTVKTGIQECGTEQNAEWRIKVKFCLMWSTIEQRL